MERETQGEVTGQGRPCSPKMVQSAEGWKGKDKRERIILVVRSPCQENYPADARTGRHKSVLVSANPAWTNSGVVKKDKSSRGSVDTTKTRLDPQRVGMCSGETPIGATKGKQTNTMATCQTHARFMRPWEPVPPGALPTPPPLWTPKSSSTRAPFCLRSPSPKPRQMLPQTPYSLSEQIDEKAEKILLDIALKCLRNKKSLEKQLAGLHDILDYIHRMQRKEEYESMHMQHHYQQQQLYFHPILDTRCEACCASWTRIRRCIITTNQTPQEWYDKPPTCAAGRHWRSQPWCRRCVGGNGQAIFFSTIHQLLFFAIHLPVVISLFL